MAKRGRTKNEILTRDPHIITRDPHTEKTPRKPRHYIPANMPTVCPTCGHNTRIDGGCHKDIVRKRILQYRTCVKCKKKLVSDRPMTKTEVEKNCQFADGVAEFEQLIANKY